MFGSQSELKVKLRQRTLLKATNCGSCGTSVMLDVSGTSMKKFQEAHEHWEYAKNVLSVSFLIRQGDKLAKVCAV